jgi:hypothetical protein
VPELRVREERTIATGHEAVTPSFVAARGLMLYGVGTAEQYQQAASYIGRQIGEPKRWTRNTFSENYANISELWKP